eukprot:1147649-Pelagomonas_calceolata.AAC.1
MVPVQDGAWYQEGDTWHKPFKGTADIFYELRMQQTLGLCCDRAPDYNERFGFQWHDWLK